MVRDYEIMYFNVYLSEKIFPAKFCEKTIYSNSISKFVFKNSYLCVVFYFQGFRLRRLRLWLGGLRD